MATNVDGTNKIKHCTCGREQKANKHCPACGSASCYAKEANSIQLQLPNTGVDCPAEFLTAMGYRCRKCGLNFHEAMPCEAPRFESKTMAERRRKEEASTRVATALQEAGGSREALLEQMFGKKEAKT